MSIFTLVWSYLKARPLNTAINIILLSLGIAVITLLLLFNTQLEQKISTNARGIDLVVGAKGSPLQLILCNIFHIDFPTGNIKLNDADRIAANRLVKKAIPLGLGDSYVSYRIVGTSLAYAELYHAELAEGKWFDKPLDVTIGANVARLAGLQLGDRFASTHGMANTGDTHRHNQYLVTGIMKPTNTVVDNLILTAVESVWLVHEHTNDEPGNNTSTTGEQHADDHHHVADSTVRRSRLVPSVEAADSLREVTAVLIQYRSPMGAIQMPRFVNAQSSLQAASPAFETARLFSILGVGVDILMAFAYVLVVISGLSIFIALYNSLKERRYDLAIMRSMGATRSKLLVSIVLEGGLLTLMGSIIGLLMGHGVLILLGTLVEETQKAGVTGLVFFPQEWIILGGSVLLGLACAIIPGIQAYRTDISKILAAGE